MKKRILFIIGIVTALLLAMSLCACAGKTDNGADGTSSAAVNGTGISITAAYNQATDLGFTGTLEEFVALISGKDGLNGTDGKDGINGTDGINGQDGKDGVNGQDGKDGRGITGVWVNANGDLIVTFTDGTYVNAGSVVVRCYHSYSGWQTGVAVTCTSIGYDYRTCSQCGNKDYRFREQLGHYYSGAVTVIKATCTEVGLSVLTCTRCGDTQSRVIDTLAHDYSAVDDNCIHCGVNRLDVDYIFTLIDDGTAYEIKCKNRKLEGEVVIPAEYHGLPVTKIGNAGFATMQGMTKVVIPEGIVEIGVAAFYQCTSLKTVMIPKTVTGIERMAFVKTDLEAITVDPANPKYKSVNNCLIEIESKTLIRGCNDSVIPSNGSVEIIGTYAFHGCDEMTEIVIPDGVVEIGVHAFAMCYNIEDITLPDSLRRIGYSVFDQTAYYRDEGNWSDGVLYIGKFLIKADGRNLQGAYTVKEETIAIADQAFWDCSKLESITIGAGVQEIGAYAFEDCSKLESITIGVGVQVIGASAFKGCSNLTQAVFLSPDGWSRQAKVSELEALDLSDPAEAAELLKDYNYWIYDNGGYPTGGYGYVWYKSDAIA